MFAPGGTPCERSAKRSPQLPPPGSDGPSIPGCGTGSTDTCDHERRNGGHLSGLTGSGTLTNRSPFTVPETVDRIRRLLDAKGLELFALVDHSGAAGVREDVTAPLTHAGELLVAALGVDRQSADWQGVVERNRRRWRTVLLSDRRTNLCLNAVAGYGGWVWRSSCQDRWQTSCSSSGSSGHR